MAVLDGEDMCPRFVHSIQSRSKKSPQLGHSSRTARKPLPPSRVPSQLVVAAPAAAGWGLHPACRDKEWQSSGCGWRLPWPISGALWLGRPSSASSRHCHHRGMMRHTVLKKHGTLKKRGEVGVKGGRKGACGCAKNGDGTHHTHATSPLHRCH